MMNQLNTTLAFLKALLAGSASFTVTINSKKRSVTLQNNGISQGPTIGAMAQLVSNVLMLAETNTANAVVKIGNNTWTITVD